MDIDSVKTDQPVREFLAVVFAGFGNALAPLTNDYGDEPCPKALLPVANKPLIEYTLDWLEKSGIQDVLLICPSRHRSAIHHHIHSDTSSTLRIDLQTYDESQKRNLGTCDLLRQFSSRIPEDFVILPCDFIPSPAIPLSALLNRFRVDVLADDSLATAFWFAGSPPEKGSNDDWGPPSVQFPIVWESTTSTLLHIDTPDDKEKNAEEIKLDMSMLMRYPHTKLSSSLDDSHVYICRRAVIDLLQQKPHFSSLREEFFPWLCKMQYSRSKRIKYAHILNGMKANSSQTLSLQHSSLLNTSPFVDDDLSSPIDTEQGKVARNFKIGIVVHNSKPDPPLRVNTLHTFLEINRRLLSTVTYSLPVDPKDRSLIDQKARISADSIVGESTQISERTTIKRSVIGRHCTIGKMVKITGCVLLDHCVVEDGAKLDSCILGKSTQVGQKAEMSRCVTQAGYEVGQGEIAKGEKFEVSHWMVDPDTPVLQHHELQSD